MAERLTSQENQRDPREIADKAIERALDGFAADGGRWVDAKDTFTEAANHEWPLDAALEVALSRAEDGAESTPNEARMRFWDNMDPNAKEGEEPKPAIERALDGYASSQQAWMTGKTAFEVALRDKDASVQGALEAALDATSKHAEVESTEAEAEDRFYGFTYDPLKDPRRVHGARNGVVLRRGGGEIAISVGRTQERRPSSSELTSRGSRKALGRAAARLMGETRNSL